MEKELKIMAEDIASKAKTYMSGYGEEELLDMATELWAKASEEHNQIRPAFGKVKEFLADIIKNVLKNISSKNDQLAVVTLTIATQELILYLSQGHDLSFLTTFRIPLELLAAIIFSQVLKEMDKRL